jgi:hypothetical protein
MEGWWGVCACVFGGRRPVKHSVSLLPVLQRNDAPHLLLTGVPAGARQVGSFPFYLARPRGLCCTTLTWFFLMDRLTLSRFACVVRAPSPSTSRVTGAHPRLRERPAATTSTSASASTSTSTSTTTTTAANGAAPSPLPFWRVSWRRFSSRYVRHAP